jgi:hypothetical protein
MSTQHAAGSVCAAQNTSAPYRLGGQKVGEVCSEKGPP